MTTKKRAFRYYLQRPRKGHPHSYRFMIDKELFMGSTGCVKYIDAIQVSARKHEEAERYSENKQLIQLIKQMPAEDRSRAEAAAVLISDGRVDEFFQAASDLLTNVRQAGRAITYEESRVLNNPGFCVWSFKASAEDKESVKRRYPALHQPPAQMPDWVCTS